MKTIYCDSVKEAKAKIAAGKVSAMVDTLFVRMSKRGETPIAALICVDSRQYLYTRHSVRRGLVNPNGRRKAFERLYYSVIPFTF